MSSKGNYFEQKENFNQRDGSLIDYNYFGHNNVNNIVYLGNIYINKQKSPNIRQILDYNWG